MKRSLAMTIRIQNKKSILLALLSIVTAAYYILPALSIQLNYSVALTFIIVATCLIIAYVNFNRFSYKLLLFAIAIVYISLLYLLLTDTKSIDPGVSNYWFKRFTSKVYQMAAAFFPLFLYERVHHFCSVGTKKIIAVCAYGLVAFVVIKTSVELSQQSNITRLWVSYYDAGLKNVGGYYFICALPFMIVLCFLLNRKSHSLLIKLLALGVMLWLFSFLLIAQYTLSLLVSLIGILIVLLSRKRSKVFIAAVFFVFIFLLSVPYLLELTIPLIESDQIATRLNELYLFLTTGETSTINLGGRLDLYQKTIAAFLDSPLWGNRNLDFDGHATFLTVLSDVGLLGAIPYYCLYYQSVAAINRIVGRNNYLPMVIILIVTGLTNPIHSSLFFMFTVWFIVPLSIELLNTREDRQCKIG